MSRSQPRGYTPPEATGYMPIYPTQENRTGGAIRSRLNHRKNNSTATTASPADNPIQIPLPAGSSIKAFFRTE